MQAWRSGGRVRATGGRFCCPQLGTGDTGLAPAPVRVEAMHGARAVQLAAAKFHSVALTQDGAVYTWGFGRGGRLGARRSWTEMRILCMAAKYGLNVLFCILNRTKCFLFVGASSWRDCVCPAIHQFVRPLFVCMSV
jgi:Regulator of chromosome condensation (RCC1) repeat